jgi:uncharacterized protein (TIGR04222 family)
MLCQPPKLQQLWHRILVFSLDDPTSRLTFTRRLARENGWTNGYAVRVVAEYKRFMFLVIATGHPVTPSEDVDQVWHLHMAYTQSYWQDFCGEVVGCEVHHGPAKGKAGEKLHFTEQYDRTKVSYAAMFGEMPPVDIWPSAEQRFGEDLQWQRVNVRNHWVIPKPRLPRWLSGSRSHEGLPRSSAIGKTAAAAAMIPLTFGVINPLDFGGVEFLQFFALIGVIAIVLAIVIRLAMLSMETAGVASPDDLEPLQLALLTDQGRLRFAHAGMSALVSGKQAVIEETGTSSMAIIALGRGTTYQASAPTSEPSSSLQRLQRRLAALGTTSVADAVKESMEVAKDEEEELETRQLLRGNWFASPVLWLSIAPLLVVIALGLAKIGVGISRNKPVMFLVIGVLVVTAIMVIGFFRKPRRTKTGDHVLEQALDQHAALESESTEEARVLRPESVALAVGLFGTAYLAGSELDLLRQSMPNVTQGGWSNFSSSDGGCGSDGGGCGGGCGGGGCGGCGGD